MARKWSGFLPQNQTMRRCWDEFHIGHRLRPPVLRLQQVGAKEEHEQDSEGEATRVIPVEFRR